MESRRDVELNIQSASWKEQKGAGQGLDQLTDL